MQHAVAELTIALKAAQDNAPLYEAEGRLEQAQLARDRASAFLHAITLITKFYELMEYDQTALRKAWNLYWPEKELEDIAVSMGYSFD